MSSEIQPKLLRKMTVRRLLEVLQTQGPASRADLTRLSGISAPTVSKAVASLLELGLVEEGDAAEAVLGRPAKVLRLATDHAQVLGIVLDAHRCDIVQSSFDGNIDPACVRTVNTPGDYESLIEKLATEAKTMMARTGVTTLNVAVSIPGLVNREGVVSLSPNLPITNGKSPAADLSAALGVECVPYQEMDALCLGERMFGGATQLDDFAVLDISTGLGLGVMNGGQLLEGNNGMAGELGHLPIDPGGRLCGCGNHGCLETLATDTAFAHYVGERADRTLDVEEAISLVRSGDLHADDELRLVSDKVALAIAAVVNLFNPASLFVYGHLFEAQDGLFDHIIDIVGKIALKPCLLDCTIVQAKGNKHQAVIAGAIAHYTDALGPSLD